MTWDYPEIDKLIFQDNWHTNSHISIKNQLVDILIQESESLAYHCPESTPQKNDTKTFLCKNWRKCLAIKIDFWSISSQNWQLTLFIDKKQNILATQCEKFIPTSTF